MGDPRRGKQRPKYSWKALVEALIYRQELKRSSKEMRKQNDEIEKVESSVLRS